MMSIHRLLSSSLTVPHWQTRLSAASDSAVLLRRRHLPSWKMHSESQILISQRETSNKCFFGWGGTASPLRCGPRLQLPTFAEESLFAQHRLFYFFHTADSPPVMFCSCSLCNVSFQNFSLFLSISVLVITVMSILCNYKMVPSPILPYLEIHIIKN